MTKAAQLLKWNSSIGRRLASAAMTLVVVFGLGAVSTNSARAQTWNESVLYAFTGGANGANPWGGLISDAKGNLYSTTNAGGDFGYGTVFKVDASGNETVLYSFKGGTDRAYPLAGVIMDSNGNLYGTTSGRDVNSDWGTVFKVDPSGNETVLYSFTGEADGAVPQAALIFDAKGNLYGTTTYGGTSNSGTVFKVNPKKSTNNETVLYSFGNWPDGGAPQSSLVFDSKGNLYGTTTAGGTSTWGVVFKVNPKKRTETLLYEFTGDADGGLPYAGGLIWDVERENLYGTTMYGGASKGGVVFKVNPKKRENNETVICSFEGTHGTNPLAGVIMDSKGNLYGTTWRGGALGYGTVFEVNPKQHRNNEAVIYSFMGTDGQGSSAGLIWDKSGKLYGTTTKGGASGDGVVFKLSR